MGITSRIRRGKENNKIIYVLDIVNNNNIVLNYKTKLIIGDDYGINLEALRQAIKFNLVQPSAINKNKLQPHCWILKLTKKGVDARWHRKI